MRQAICLAISMRSERDDTSALASLKRGEKSAHFWWRNDICAFQIKDFWVSSDWLNVGNYDILKPSGRRLQRSDQCTRRGTTFFFVVGSSPANGAENITFLSHERRGNAWRRIFFSLTLASWFVLFLAYWSIFIAHGEMQIGLSVIMAFGTKSHRPFITFVLVLLRCGGRGCNIYEYPRK